MKLKGSVWRFNVDEFLDFLFNLLSGLFLCNALVDLSQQVSNNSCVLILLYIALCNKRLLVLSFQLLNVLIELLHEDQRYLAGGYNGIFLSNLPLS